jgi:hypothetical protein
MEEERLELKETISSGITVRTWKRSGTDWSCAPWLFSIQPPGGQEKTFAGVPNYCITRRSALVRGVYRAKWLATGVWSKHYQVAYAVPHL